MTPGINSDFMRQLLVMLFAIGCTSSQKTINPTKPDNIKHPIPVSLRFKNFQPADSIADFMKVYLQAKEFTIASDKKSIELMVEEMDSKRDVIFSLRESASSVNDMTQKILKLCDVVCNLLIIRMYTHSDDSNQLNIDSIQWKVVRLPPKDSTQSKTYNSLQHQKTDVYVYLKGFIDEVILSKDIN